MMKHIIILEGLNFCFIYTTSFYCSHQSILFDYCINFETVWSYSRRIRNYNEDFVILLKYLQIMFGYAYNELLSSKSPINGITIRKLAINQSRDIKYGNTNDGSNRYKTDKSIPVRCWLFSRIDGLIGITEQIKSSGQFIFDFMSS